MPAVFDQLKRPLGSLRISVTDRCNLRCAYCMPEEDYVWLKRDELLSFEEIAKLARVFTRLGAGKIRLTGGEPLLRRDLDRLINQLTTDENLSDLALTTNGVFLATQAAVLRNAGLGRITVSLDTLQPERFRALTRRDNLRNVLEGIHAAANAVLTK
jgi:cyclic pyranopterin phosphate synthase